MTSLENGKTYELTNKHGMKTVVIVKGGKVYAENGAFCGTVKAFVSDARYSTLDVVEVM